MESVLTWLSSIPDVIWAAIVASGLTFLGVNISNSSNRKYLLIQLEHASKQQDKEREQRVRKQVYMEAAEAIAESIKDITLLPNRVIYTDNLEICDKLLQALAKVHMVGTLETVKNTSQFMEKFNQTTLPIIPEIHKFVNIKNEIARLTKYSEIKLDLMNRVNKNFEQLDDNAKQNPDVLNVYTNTIDAVGKEHEAICNEMESKVAEQKAAHTKLLSMCLNAGMYLQKESLNVLLSIRKELNLEMDTEEYLSYMEAFFKKSEGFYTQENIKKLTQG